jgi:hypothetical protein
LMLACPWGRRPWALFGDRPMDVGCPSVLCPVTGSTAVDRQQNAWLRQKPRLAGKEVVHDAQSLWSKNSIEVALGIV